MTLPNENKYSYVSEYLFINFLNTINIKKVTVTDFLEEPNGLQDWLCFMETQKVLTGQQAKMLRKFPIDANLLKEFRNDWRSYFTEPDLLQKAFKDLATYTKSTPLYFDEQFRPVPSEGGTKGLLALLSFDILQASRKGVLRKLKKCENPVCYAFFINASGKQKWCSMEVCGNRQKAKRHYVKKENS